jgi:uncharacterized membrane protein YbhN (UPF0104 family)
LANQPLLLPLVCAAGAAVFVVLHYGDDGGFARLLAPSGLGLLGILGALLLRWGSATFKFRWLLRRWGTSFSWRDSFQLQLTGICGAAVTPAASGASPAYLWYLWRRGVPGPLAMAVAAYTTALDAILFAVTVPAVLPAYVRMVGGELPLGVVLTALGLSLGALVFGSLLIGAPRLAVRWIGALLGPLPRLRRRTLPPLLRAAAAIGELRRAHPSFHLGMLVVTALEWLGIYAVLPTAAWTLGLEFSWSALLVVQHVVQVVAFVFPTPGGSGLFEAGLPVAAGVAWPAEAAASLILLWRFWSYGIYLIVAAWFGSAFLARALQERDRAASEEKKK